MSQLLVRIVGKDFVAGLVFDEASNKVVEAAPKLKFMLRWNRQMVRRMCEWKRWKATVVK